MKEKLLLTFLYFSRSFYPNMKQLLFSIVFLIFVFQCKAQSLMDSFPGFDPAKEVIKIHKEGYYGAEAKLVLDVKKKNFLSSKYKFPLQKVPAKKYSSNTVANVSCMDIDFETYTVGPYSSTSMTSWTVSGGVSNYFNTIICPTTAIQFQNYTTNVEIHATPVTDVNCGNVSASPFGGNKIISLNKVANLSGTGSNVIRLAQTFSVTSSNYYYFYAYKGVLENGGHTCCATSNLIFNFYNCSGILQPALCDTFYAPANSLNCSDFSNWQLGGNYFYTPNWHTRGVNLSAYMGSCITVEVLAAECSTYGHIGYCYYDAKCSSEGVIINGNLLTTDSYTSCPTSATITAPPGYSSYSWQGPAGSGISALTTSAVSTSVSGNYTLTAITGTTSITQTVNLTVNSSNLNTSISAPSSSLCSGSYMTLQASGGGLSDFSWSSGSIASSILINPTVTASYSVIATNSLGCRSSDTKTITVFSSPLINLQSSVNSICPGKSVTLTAIGAGATSYSWNSGSTNQTLNVSPAVTTAYTVTAFNALGCSSSAIKTITVNPVPVIQVSFSKPLICEGDTVYVAAGASSVVSYSWSNGSSAASFSVIPLLNTVYSVTLANSSSCTSSSTSTLVVVPGTHLQLGVSPSTLCTGQSALLSASGASLNSYQWSTGSAFSSFQVSPTLTSVYSVTVSNVYGCHETQTKTLTVLISPQIQVSSSASLVCKGTPVNFNATGNVNTQPVWSTGATGVFMSANPMMTTVYTASVTAANGCVGVASIAVNVHPVTQVQISSSGTLICLGENIQLSISAGGILSYNWIGGSTSTTLTLAPAVTSIYTVTGTDANSCSSQASLSVTVSDCLGIEIKDKEKYEISVFPNPTDDIFIIQGAKSQTLELLNDLGQVLRKLSLNTENHFQYQISGLAKGIYFVRGRTQSLKVIIK